MGSPELDRLVHLSNVADLFLDSDPDFLVAHDYASLVKTYQFWNLYDLIGRQLEKLLDHPLLEVMAVKRRVENPLGYEWSKANIAEFSSTVGFVDTVVGNINLIVHQLLEKQETPYRVLVTLFRKGNGTVIASIRSRKAKRSKSRRTPGRRPSQRLRSDSAPLGPAYPGSNSVFAPYPESRAAQRRAFEQLGDRVRSTGKAVNDTGRTKERRWPAQRGLAGAVAASAEQVCVRIQPPFCRGILRAGQSHQ